MVQKIHNLDYNRLYGLRLDFDPKTHQLKVSVDPKSAPWPRLQEALMSLINIEGIKSDDIKRTKTSVTFPALTREFTLRLGLEPIGSYTLELDGQLTQTMKRPLTVSEVRRIGTFHRAMPYKQDDESLVEKARKAVFTDFHTHSSGQISPAGLVQVALDHEAYYPLEWLDEADIEVNYNRFPQSMRKDIARVPFPPRDRPGVTLSPMVEAIPLSALNPEDLAKLEAKMTMPTDRQSTFTEMENDAYYFRYPFTKNNDLIKDTLIQTAREYALQGVKHATITFASLDKPELLQGLHEAMEDIARDPVTKDVQLRFKVGIPRTFELPRFVDSLERAKVLLNSPYIIGVDVIGYELNKNKEFEAALDDFCGWANEHKPGTFVRAHAGENDKNLDNVKDTLQMGLRHENLHFQIGHGVYGMDEKALELARQLCADPENPRVTIEPNPSSVLALNNVDDLKQIPFARMVENKIPFVVSSDSSGTYSTTAVQLGLEAMYGGLSHEGFDLLQKHQTHLMNKQQALTTEKAAAIPNWKNQAGRTAFVQDMLNDLKAIPKPIIPPVPVMKVEEIRDRLKEQSVELVEANDNQPEFRKRKPVTIVGASGASWARMTADQQRESAIAIDMLIQVLDPTHAYVVQGRSKSQGIGDVLRNSMGYANDNFRANEQPAFYNYGLEAEAKFDKKTSYEHLTHMERIDGGRLDIADAVVEHTFKHQGVLIAVGGASFTRDIILKADQRGMLDDNPTNRKMMLLLECAQGASAEKAKVLSPSYRARDGLELVRKMHKQYPELFVPGFDISKLDSAYDASAARYDAMIYKAPDTVIGDSEREIARINGTGRGK